MKSNSLRVKNSASKAKVIRPERIQYKNNSRHDRAQHERHVSFDQASRQMNISSMDQSVGYTNIPLDPITQSKPTQISSLAIEYKQRQKRMDERLMKEIESNQIAPAQHYYTESKVNQEKAYSPLRIQQKPSNEEATGFYRSQRSVAMRIKDNYENDLQTLEGDKLQLIQRLNDSLLQLDKLNQEKSEMNNQLIEQYKFVRDLQRETQKCDGLNGVVNENLRVDLKREKEQNFQLKEDLKKIDQERMRYLQRLNQVQGVSQDYQIEASDMNVALRTKYVHLQALEDDYRDIIQKVEVSQRDVDQLRAMVIDTQMNLDGLRDSVREENKMRELSTDQIRAKQEQLDIVLDKHLREKYEINLIQTRNVRLLSSRLMFDSLCIFQGNRMKVGFQTLYRESFVSHAYLQGIQKARQVLKRNRQLVARKRFYTWYKNGLKPLNNLKQKEQVTSIISAKTQLSQIFSKWRTNYFKSKADKLYVHQALLQMVKSKKSYKERMLKYGFTRWRESIINSDSTKDIQNKALKNIFNKRINHLHQAFVQWQHHALDIDFHIQMNGMAQRFTKLKYTQVVFCRWREVIKFFKMKRLNRMIRTWKTIKAFMLKQKHTKGIMATVLREEYLRKKNMQQICFDAIRSERKYKKLVQMARELTQNVRPSIQQNSKFLEATTNQGELKSKVTAVKIFTKCLSKDLYSAFEKWKVTAKYKDEVLFKNVKKLILNSANLKLRDAFTSWLAYKGKVMQTFQMQFINEQEEESKMITNEMVVEKGMVNEKKVRQQCQSSKYIKKIMMGAFNRILRNKFEQWKGNLEILDIKGNGMAKIIKRMSRLKKKECFQWYRDQVENVKQDEIFHQKVKEGKFKLDQREKKRILYAIKEFSFNHKMAKNYLERIMFRMDHSQRKIGFKRWFKLMKYKNEKILGKQELEQQAIVRELAKEEGQYQDEVVHLEQSNNQLQHDLLQRSRKIINKWFLRSNGVNMKYAFVEWKEYAQKTWSQEQKMKRVISRMVKSSTIFAFKLWKEKVKHQKFALIRRNTVHEEEQIELALNMIRNNASYFSMTHEDKLRRLKKIKAEHQVFMHKQTNTLRVLIKKRDNNFYLTKEQHIIRKWHEYTMKKKQAMHYFGKVMNKAAWWVGFNNIREFQQSIQYHQKREKMAFVIQRLSGKLKMKLALLRWRKNSHYLVTMDIYQNESVMQKMMIERRKFQKISNDKALVQVQSHLRYVTMHNRLYKLRVYARIRKSLKQKVKVHQDTLEHSRRVKALRLWKGRSDTTKKVIQAAQKINKCYKDQNTARVFSEWQAHHHRVKQFLRKFATLEPNFDFIMKKISFIRIQNQADFKVQKLEKKIAKARKNGKKFLHFLFYQRLHDTFRKWKYQMFILKRQDATKKIMINNMLNHKKRSYFKDWKQESQRREVIRFNMEEGPVRIEVNKLAQDLKNLEEMLLNDGHELEHIKKWEREGDQKGKGLLKKGLCRIQCYNDELRELPNLFDRWKAWVNERKRFKYWINFMNKRCDKNVTYMQIAFDNWRNAPEQRKEVLMGIKKVDLSLRGGNTLQQLESYYTQEDYLESQVEEMNHQRDILLKAYVGSQKLALSASDANCKRAEGKAYSRIQDNYLNQKLIETKNSLMVNLGNLKGLKYSITKFEKENEDIANQNDELKQGALDGIEMAQSVDSLTNDRENLSVDIADKAIQIRKLLEDNNNLSIRLNQAQDEAIKLIKTSQVNISQQQSPMGLV